MAKLKITCYASLGARERAASTRTRARSGSLVVHGARYSSLVNETGEAIRDSDRSKGCAVPQVSKGTMIGHGHRQPCKSQQSSFTPDWMFSPT